MLLTIQKYFSKISDILRHFKAKQSVVELNFSFKVITLINILLRPYGYALHK